MREIYNLYIEKEEEIPLRKNSHWNLVQGKVKLKCSMWPMRGGSSPHGSLFLFLFEKEGKNMNKKKVLKTAAIVVGGVVLVGGAYYLGRRNLIEKLIKLYDETDPFDRVIPVMSWNKKKYGDLIYSLYAECIGD